MYFKAVQRGASWHRNVCVCVHVIPGKSRCDMETLHAFAALATQATTQASEEA